MYKSYINLILLFYGTNLQTAFASQTSTKLQKQLGNKTLYNKVYAV